MLISTAGLFHGHVIGGSGVDDSLSAVGTFPVVFVVGTRRMMHADAFAPLKRVGKGVCSVFAACGTLELKAIVFHVANLRNN